MRLRGRKGIRETIERQTDLVVLNPQDWKGRWAERFGNSRPIHVELGMGKGKFISEMSVRNPEINFIGVDMYDELIRRASEKARAAANREDGKAPDNLVLSLFNVERIEDVFEPGELRRIYLNFSDPWPKKKHARRRLTHPNFIARYIRLLDDRGEIHFKTDSKSLFEFSLNAFADMNVRLRRITLDLHKDGPAPDNVMTEYETKFAEQGMPIYRLEAVVGATALAEHEEEIRRQWGS